jgi:hypothetical protein
MEEVKNQIGEALPGALSLFVDAASEFSGKQLTTPEFFKMMENGELLAKDILPLMGKRMSIAANKGGALEKSLAGNQTAMNRLTTEWKFFQEIIFNSGFGEALTRTFNSLAFALKNNDGAAKAIGITLGGLIDGVIFFWCELMRSSKVQETKYEKHHEFSLGDEYRKKLEYFVKSFEWLGLTI